MDVLAGQLQAAQILVALLKQLMVGRNDFERLLLALLVLLVSRDVGRNALFVLLIGMFLLGQVRLERRLVARDLNLHLDGLH